MNKTLFKYIFNIQLKTMCFVSFLVFCLIFLFDFAEITRKFGVSNIQETLFAIKLTLLKVPTTLCEILHYVYFITATFSLWNLCRSNQVIILKSTGNSPQQILFPFISFAFFMAILWLLIVQPSSKFLYTAYNKNISNNASITGINKNIWIDYLKNHQIIFIKSISDNNIEGIHIFNTLDNSRIFAKKAYVNNNQLKLRDVILITNNRYIENKNTLNLYNNISNDLITLLTKTPKNHNIYQLKNVYKIETDNQVNLHLYKLALHKLLAHCTSFLLLAVMAAIICFPINRYKTKTNIAIKVISIAILMKFANDLFISLAYSGVLPIALAAWAVVLTLLCISMAILVWREV